MALPYPTDPSLPENPSPVFSDSTAARGDHLRANNAEIWANFSYLMSLIDPVGNAIGDNCILRAKHTAISSTFPWFNLSLPDQSWTTSNYSTEFINEMRSRKAIYDELNTAVSSFSGAWSGDTFTLDDTTINNEFLAELAEEYLYAGSPTTNFRLLSDGTNEFNIIAISTSARTIQVNLDSKTATGTSISIYLHRVYGSTTSARHHSLAGCGFYAVGGGKVSGFRRRDAGQQITGSINKVWLTDATPVTAGALSASENSANRSVGETYHGEFTLSFDSANSPDARTRSKTEMESGTLNIYLYVGSYTA